jgi:hypothetical protein
MNTRKTVLRLFAFCVSSVSVFSVQAQATDQLVTKVAIQPEVSSLVEAMGTSENLELELLVVEDTNLAMLNGFANTSVTRQKWTDSEVSAYEQQYGQRPITLYFGIQADKDSKVVINNVLSGNSTTGTLYYVYTTSKAYSSDGDSKSGPTLKPFFTLMSEEQNSELFMQHSFLPLPASAIHRNRVAMGLEEPSIEGGYK